MRAPGMLGVAVLLAVPAFAQKPAPRPVVYVGPIPDPAVFITEAHVRVYNRAGLGVVIGIDDVRGEQRKSDGIMDRVVVLQGADEVKPFDGIAMVQVRKPAELCKPPAGVNLLDPEHPWICPVAPDEVIITGKGIRLAAFVGARSNRVPDDAVVPARMVGIAVYGGKFVNVPLAKLDAVEFAQQ